MSKTIVQEKIIIEGNDYMLVMSGIWDGDIFKILSSYLVHV